MKVLDLFCGGGGAARGYIAAGASVTGIDNKWHGNSYPGVFFQEDAISFVKKYGWLYDFIHASPPCQGYSETNFFIPIPSHGKCSGVSKRYAEENNIDYRDMSVTGKGRNKGTKDRWLKIMGIKDTNMTQAEVVESIPPAYTEYIFRTWREFYA